MVIASACLWNDTRGMLHFQEDSMKEKDTAVIAVHIAK